MTHFRSITAWFVALAVKGFLTTKNAIRKVYRFADLPKPAKIEKLAEKWRHYCSVASWYLWRSLDA